MGLAELLDLKGIIVYNVAITHYTGGVDLAIAAMHSKAYPVLGRKPEEAEEKAKAHFLKMIEG